MEEPTLTTKFTHLAYKTRFFSVAALALMLGLILTRYRLPDSWQLHAFASLTAIVWATTSMPIRWRQIFFERPFLFRRRAKGLVPPAYGVFLIFWLIIGAGSIFLLALFTLPLSREDEMVIIDPSSLDYRWTVALMAASILSGFLLAKSASLVLGAKPARYAFLVLPLAVGLIYSAGNFGVSSISSCLDQKENTQITDCVPFADDASFEHLFLYPSTVETDIKDELEDESITDEIRQLFTGGDSCRSDTRRTVFNPPTACEAIGVLTNFFGSGAFSDVRTRLVSIFDEVPSAQDVENIQTSLSSELKEVSEIEQQLVTACQQVGVETRNGYRSLREGESVESSASSTISSVFGSLQNACMQTNSNPLADLLVRAGSPFDWEGTCKQLESLDPNVDPSVMFREAWSSLQCDGLIGQNACRGDEAPCHPVLEARQELRSLDRNLEAIAGSLNDMEAALADPLESDDSTKSNSDLADPGLLLYQYALVDGFLADQIRRLVDILAIYGRDTVVETVTGSSTSSNLEISREAIERPCSASVDAHLLERKRQHWCKQSLLRKAVLILLSPNILQGYVLSVYVVFLLLVFRQRDGGDPDGLSSMALQQRVLEILQENVVKDKVTPMTEVTASLVDKSP
ncbi:MAG: hypothetical protein AAFR65_13850, partial [Pseudomonadota bacterium]